MLIKTSKHTLNGYISSMIKYKGRGRCQIYQKDHYNFGQNSVKKKPTYTGIYDNFVVRSTWSTEIFFYFTKTIVREEN